MYGFVIIRFFGVIIGLFLNLVIILEVIYIN